MPGGQNVRLGHNAKITINSQTFGVVGGELRFVGGEVDVSDTESTESAEGAFFEHAKIGSIRLEATIEFQHSDDLNVHQVPLSLRPGSIIDLKVYANGMTDDPYHCPTFLCREGSRALALRQAQTGRVVGRSNDVFTYPGDA